MESHELSSINQVDEQMIDSEDTLIDNSSIDDIELDSNLKSISSINNIVIGNAQWIIDDETTQESLIAEVKADVDGRIDSLFEKLRDRLPLNESEEESVGNPFTEENPFAEGENPFGEEEFTPPPAFENSPLPSQEILEDFTPTEESQTDNLVVEDFNPTEESQADNLVVEDLTPTEESQTDNPFADGEGVNPFDGGEGENPFDDGEGGNPFDGGEGENPSQSFDMLGMIAGEDLPFLNASEGDYNYSAIPNQSTSETLRTIRDNLFRFNANLTYPGAFGDGNDTPLQTPNDLLTLFINDMFSFNNTANSFQELVGDHNPFSNGEYNPFGEGTLAEEIPFDILNVALDGLLPFNGSENVFSTPEGEIPIGNGNQDFGSENAVIGNANWNYGNLNATIGNGNWNWDGTSNNSTVGNGNWHLDFSVENKTVGNGNWYWDSSSENTTLGNGNWHFGESNTTIGNGNWNFGDNNTIIGNGNRVYTDNSIVIGNGNWSVVIDKSAEIADDLLGELETISMGVGVKRSADMLVDSVMNKMGEIFQPLTEDFDEAALNTYNERFLNSDNGNDFLISV